MPPAEGPPSRDDSERLTYKDLGVQSQEAQRPYDWNSNDPELTDQKPYDQATNTGGKPVVPDVSNDSSIATVTSIEEHKAKKEADTNPPKPPPGPRGGTRKIA